MNYYGEAFMWVIILICELVLEMGIKLCCMLKGGIFFELIYEVEELKFKD